MRTLSATKNWIGFWSTLKETGPDFFSSFEFSGFVFAVLATFLQNRGVNIIPAKNNDVFAQLGSVQLLLSSSEYQNLRNGIAGLSVTDEEFAQYRAELNGEPWDEAGIAMQKAKILLVEALSACQESHQRLFCEVG